MQIGSSAFNNGEKIPAEFTCDGENVSPPLAISGVPAETVSLALIIDDIDAPAGVFDHWIVFDLPVVSEIKKAETAGVGGRNSFGKNGYDGPCPGSGEHRYYFRIYALDKKLDLPAGSSRKKVEAAMTGHILATGELMGRYAK